MVEWAEIERILDETDCLFNVGGMSFKGRTYHPRDLPAIPWADLMDYVRDGRLWVIWATSGPFGMGRRYPKTLRLTT